MYPKLVNKQRCTLCSLPRTTGSFKISHACNIPYDEEIWIAPPICIPLGILQQMFQKQYHCYKHLEGTLSWMTFKHNKNRHAWLSHNDLVFQPMECVCHHLYWQHLANRMWSETVNYILQTIFLRYKNISKNIFCS